MSGFRGKKVDPIRRSNGRPIFTGNPTQDNAATITPPRLRDGQKRCPACRNGAHVVKSGSLARHRDLFGNPCWNRSTGEATVSLLSLPPVVLGPTGESTNLVPPDGQCQECAKPIPPMRRLCGRCMSRRHA